MKEIAAAFGELPQETIAAVKAAGEYSLALPGGPVDLTPEDYEIISQDMPGWLVASDGALTLALDIEVTDALRREGTARELVNRIQNIRKDSGFEVTDKVHVSIWAEGEALKEITDCLEEYTNYIAAQTLALSVKLSSEKEGTEVAWDEGSINIKAIRN